MASRDQAGKPLVYIASPYALGDPIMNVRASLDVFAELLDGWVVTPVAPLLLFQAHLVHPRPCDVWMAYDLELLARCDALLSCNAVVGDYVQTKSAGRDREIAFARAHGIPVFFRVHELYRWARGEWEATDEG